MALPDNAQAVIIGGGIMGMATAYHLAEYGYDKIVLLERQQLSCGTTWHAAGLLTRSRASANMIALARYSLELYIRLAEETGQDIGLKQNGSLGITTSPERLEEFHRSQALVEMHGIRTQSVAAEEIAEYYPGLYTDDLVGGIFIPDDGQCNPADLNQALAKAAKSRGVRIHEQVKVVKLLHHHGKVTGVHTAQGDIAAPIVVNCTGMWSREFAADHGVALPLHACEHYYVVTEPFAAMQPTLPVLREPDQCAYYKEDAGKLLLGCFEQNARLWGHEGIPEDFCFDELAGDFEHFSPILEAAMHRFPALENAGIKTFFCGPESFSADGRYYLGPAPELEGYYVGSGFNSIGIQSAGGAGMALARWIKDKAPPFDLWDVDIRRRFTFQASDYFIRRRAPESLGDLYAMHWPYKQPETARNLRKSPLHTTLHQHGACFGVAAGWERPNWFAHSKQKPEYTHTYGQANWFGDAKTEHMAVRQGCALFDLSSFGKFRLMGRDALDILQWLSIADVDVPHGKVVYTQWLNPRGTIEADLTITRLGRDDFLITTGPASAGRDWYWLRQHLEQNSDKIEAHLIDVTAQYAIIAVMGPESRRILAAVSNRDFSNEACPFAHSLDCTIGAASVRAQRISYVGELGYELFVDSEWADHVLSVLLETQQITLAGMHTLDACRLEKGFRHFGHELSDEDNVYQAGLSFIAKPDKPIGKLGRFIGHAALIQQKQQPIERLMVQFKACDSTVMLYHHEPILCNGATVGYLTSGGYGHYVGCSIGMGYVHNTDGILDTALEQNHWMLQVGAQKIDAKASLAAWYDPSFSKMRG